MDRTVLIAGATGALGAAVARAAAARGWAVRVLVRDPARVPREIAPRLAEVVVGDVRDPAAVHRAARGVDAVFSSVGASVLPTPGRGWRGYRAVDTRANVALIDAARAAGARRFVYVSVFHPPELRRLAYVDAHERVVDHLRAAGAPFAVVRPTGFFSALASYLDLARRGPVPEIAGGRARTNPIADDDLAIVCADALAAPEPALEVACGGPEVLTRRAIVEAACAAVGVARRTRAVPAWLIRSGAAALRLAHPRIGQFLAFLAAISTRDLIAPATGTRRLADAFAARMDGAGRLASGA